METKWQKYWADHKTFEVEDFDPTLPKYFCMDMFPYPSGDGLHVGHVENYTATDIMARYKRLRGFNVLFPMGWDAFGLPAEQHAIKTGEHPSKATADNIAYFKKQMYSIGLSHDWSREINTTDPQYFKWTQWIFAQLYKKGLAYQSFAPVNWCPALGTVLANEEVIDGKSERGGHPVIKRPMRQWVLKITEYADRLLDDLDELDWGDHVKEMQRNWIGKSHGANVDFSIDGSSETFTIFTTRPDTLFGATFCVLAPEHELVEKITTTDCKAAIEKYVEEAASKSDVERSALNKEKTGVFTGAFAINPVNSEKIPIYIADYVMVSYGTGAIMAVPGHDERDHEFATKYKIPIKRVLTGGDEDDINIKAHTGDGTLVNSQFLDGLKKDAAIAKIGSWLEERGGGQPTVTYKLRDWLFSRQRYWGEPFPLAHDEEGNVHLLDESTYPVTLPELDDYKPSGTGEPPLAKASDWLEVDVNGKPCKRETNTMPQWAGSCWYYLRYIDPHNPNEFCDPKKEAYWMPVDLYIGGLEHAVLHLLYARFWHKVLYDCGVVSTKEPFKKLVNQGMILGDNNEKMSKSRGNVVNPDDVIAQWGADSMRLYSMFMGPLEAAKPWQTNGIAGVNRFVKRFWRLAIGEDGKINTRVSDKPDSDELRKAFHKTVKKVTDDTETMQFNTGIAAMMEFINAAYKVEHINKETVEKFTIMLAPYAPHVAEEVWEKLGNTESITYQSWPTYDPAQCVEDSVTISVQVNGKLRGTLALPKGAAKEDALGQAKAIGSVQKHLEGKTIRKEIFVPNKIINFVVG